MRFMDSTILAYIAGFLDGDGSIFFQIVPRKDYIQKFQIRSSIAFYQKTECVEILDWLKEIFKCGYIRHRKTGVSDYTIVESKEVRRILELLKPYVRLKKKQVVLGLEILDKLEEKETNQEDKTIEIDENDFILKYREPKSKEELRGGYVGTIVRFDRNHRRFLVHGTPFPDHDKIYFSTDILQSSSVNDFWCMKVT